MPQTMVAAPPAPSADAFERARLERAAGDDFEIAELIGRGGFADVFRALDRRLKRTVAIKVLRAETHRTPDAVERFRREAESIAALRHPHILPIHAIGERDDVVWLVLDHVDGESLEQLLSRTPRIDIPEATRLLGEIAAGLLGAHRAGIAHRDVKPANVLLDGDARTALLMDFGIARAMGADDVAMTRTGTFVGTPHYLSPEQAAGDTADHRADLYSLGVVGYRMLTGVLPFDGPTASVLIQHLAQAPRPIRELRPDCPDWLAGAVERCLAKSPEDRWQSAAELIAALGDESVERTTTGPVTNGAVARSDQTSRFRRAILGASTIALGSLLIDLLATGALTISALIVIACAAFVALRSIRLWVAGEEPLALLLHPDQATRSSATEEFGRHAGTIRRARLERAAIVRELNDLSNVERQSLSALTPTADRIVGRVSQIARRMSALDERIGAERARQSSGATRPTRMIEEMVASRARLEQELSEAEGALARLRGVTRAADTADSLTLRRELNHALADAERAVRGEASAQAI